MCYKCRNDEWTFTDPGFRDGEGVRVTYDFADGVISAEMIAEGGCIYHEVSDKLMQYCPFCGRRLNLD